MEVLQFANMLGDKAFPDLKKMKYKYPECFDEFIETLKAAYYKKLPLKDFAGENTVYLSTFADTGPDVVKRLYSPQTEAYGMGSLEEEILSTSKIESIDFSRESVRNIVRGKAPKNGEEMRIYGLKKGFDFIADESNDITEENIYKLYMLAIGDYLEDDVKLPAGSFYRNAPVYVVGNEVEHTGLDCAKILAYMKNLVRFANEKDGLSDLAKAAVIHFYIAYIHPYFDGNGRMARLMHLWYLIRQGYESTLFVPFSASIEKSRSRYYKAIKLVEDNARISGLTDVTPFLVYFNEYVYNKAGGTADSEAVKIYKKIESTGRITIKEAELWRFVYSAYVNCGFTTKQLEKDYGNAAYATIRAFVLKFMDIGLLTATKMSNKVVYKVKR